MDNSQNFVSLVLPAYNEEAIIEKNVHTVVNYMRKLNKYKWEIVIVNDGSKDNTQQIADECEEEIPELRVIHHPINLNLGRALQTGFRNAKGNIIVVLDIDLSYYIAFCISKTGLQCKRQYNCCPRYRPQLFGRAHRNAGRQANRNPGRCSKCISIYERRKGFKCAVYQSLDE